MSVPPKPYDLATPDLIEQIEACTPDAKHAGLLSLLRGVVVSMPVKLVTKRGGDGSHYLARRKVIGRDGTVVHADHKAWLREQLAVDHGDAAVTFSRLSAGGFLLTRCDITLLYIVHDRGSDNPSDFVQTVVRLEEESVERMAFDSSPWGPIRTLSDLEEVVEGGTVGDSMRSLVGEPIYRLDSMVNVEAFVSLAEACDAEMRAWVRKRQYVVSSSFARDQAAGAPQEVRTHDQMFPGWDKVAPKQRRLFEDWRNSSAGRSGARFCDHWVLSLSDWTDPNSGMRHLSLVPVWTFSQRLAEIDGNQGDCYAHFGRLQTLDRRVKVPFAWFFYMLHGNRVHDRSGRRVLVDAESGLLVLPEHDYRVLKAWSEEPYGF